MYDEKFETINRVTVEIAERKQKLKRALLGLILTGILAVFSAIIGFVLEFLGENGVFFLWVFGGSVPLFINILYVLCGHLKIKKLQLESEKNE